MIRRHPIVTVLVVITVLYLLVTQPTVVIDGFAALGGLAGKLLDSIGLALSEVV